jgi:hypothetical protein
LPAANDDGRGDQQKEAEMAPQLVRPVQPQNPVQSPMSAPVPGEPPASVTPPAPSVTRREWIGYLVWGTLAVIVTVFELLAWLDKSTYFPTISETAGNLQARHNWTAMPILAGLTVLGARIVFYPWPFSRSES